MKVTFRSAAVLALAVGGCTPPNPPGPDVLERASTVAVTPEPFYPGQSIHIDAGFIPKFIPTRFPCGDTQTGQTIVSANPRFAVQIVELQETDGKLVRGAIVSGNSETADPAKVNTWITKSYDVVVPSTNFEAVAAGQSRVISIIRVESALNYTGCSTGGGGSGDPASVSQPYAGRGYRLNCPSPRAPAGSGTLLRCAFKYDPSLGDGLPEIG